MKKIILILFFIFLTPYYALGEYLIDINITASTYQVGQNIPIVIKIKSNNEKIEYNKIKIDGENFDSLNNLNSFKKEESHEIKTDIDGNKIDEVVMLQETTITLTGKKIGKFKNLGKISFLVDGKEIQEDLVVNNGLEINIIKKNDGENNNSDTHKNEDDFMNGMIKGIDNFNDLNEIDNFEKVFDGDDKMNDFKEKIKNGDLIPDDNFINNQGETLNNQDKKKVLQLFEKKKKIKNIVIVFFICIFLIIIFWYLIYKNLKKENKKIIIPDNNSNYFDVEKENYDEFQKTFFSYLKTIYGIEDIDKKTLTEIMKYIPREKKEIFTKIKNKYEEYYYGRKDEEAKNELQKYYNLFINNYY